MSGFDPPAIDAELAGRLVAPRFPQWTHLPVTPVAFGGSDNRTFRLRDGLKLRLATRRRR